MNLSQLKDDEKLFLSRLGDLFTLSREKCKTRFSLFLNGLQIEIAKEFILQNKLDNYMLYGGRENAERLVLGAFSPYDTPEEQDFPITHVTSRYPENAELSHRDFLGAMMALKITRESIGDILISPGRCDFFVLAPVLDIILNELTKVGSFGVKTAKGTPGDFVVLERFDTVRGTIGSARIDSLVSMLTKLSREKAAQLISSDRVERNYIKATDGARKFNAGDIFTIRGYGKYIVDEIQPPTRKDRLPVVCRKYI